MSKWLVKPSVTRSKSGDVLAEIETDKATMEVESIDEGVVAELVVAAGTEGVPVGQVIMRLQGEGEEAAPAPRAVCAEAPAELRSRHCRPWWPKRPSRRPSPQQNATPDPSRRAGEEQRV